ncbi:hypothetical protein LTR48_000601 [Friedmanniomyces endolithicus]|uniref:DNA recombination and repair protein Rad51-like C-terminal domain-containing protein n=2 Tax=Dothideomycetidae TaxID=451867 RepID=A0A4U0USE8_9PEZI|nr:hypothetical protein LTS09_008784 [Friedmanniomyces endolithicus]KAK0945216.1 hypothetical protein LTR29_003308 [Friedmanniomyces endolithicus]KAK1094302.1 hypothetical protein LTR48_000601 [Friedmanniomyces endolithicus]KAK5148167.1 hypothetical protein LTR32_000479 [Rachicladosporium monterosium]TKA38362.1 hypothetical protein B0A54_10653 [Friedmanniomyces endolithicus]
MAEDLGKRLLAETEETDFDEIFQILRLQSEPSSKSWFNVPQLDRLVNETNQEPHSTSSKITKPTQPVLELTSTSPGNGKTHLLYHLTALAVLPSDLGGKESCVVILDTDGTFSIPRLAQQLLLLIKAPSSTDQEIDDILLSSLKHIHIFRPQSLASSIATLTTLPAYLFDASRHYSLDRAASFIAIASASAYYWQTKASEENAALFASTAAPLSKPSKQQQQVPAAYAQLTTALRSASLTFHCPIVLTSQHLGGPVNLTTTPHDYPADSSHALRPSLPAPLSTLPTLQLILTRLPVRKFPAGISLEEAAREAVDRQAAVGAGKYSCVVNEWGLGERVLSRLHTLGDGKKGFGFRVGAEGVRVDRGGEDGE